MPSVPKASFCQSGQSMVKSPLARMARFSSVAYTVASCSGAAIAGFPGASRVQSGQIEHGRWRMPGSLRPPSSAHCALSTAMAYRSYGSVHLYWGSPIGVIVYPAVAEGQLAQIRVEASVHTWRQARRDSQRPDDIMEDHAAAGSASR